MHLKICSKSYHIPTSIRIIQITYFVNSGMIPQLFDSIYSSNDGNIVSRYLVRSHALLTHGLSPNIAKRIKCILTWAFVF